MEGLIAYFNGSNSSDFTMTVDILECRKVELFLLQDTVIAKLVSRLLVVELVLKHMDLIV